MRRLTPGFAALLAGCMVGPSYRAPAPVPAHAALGVPRMADSTRAFFDSLAVARARDSVAAAAAPLTQRLLVQDSLAGVAWLDILRDTTLVGLVNTALRQNRDVQTAIARIREYRADAGVARAPLFPTVTANGSMSSNQVALGFIPPVTYHASRVTGDVSWELDFWGRLRHGLDAANADAAAQVAAERGTVLSLVSDVATAYLQLLELDQEHAIAEQTLASRQATLAIARERYRQGLISELDVKQFEAQVAAPAVTLAQTERERAQTEHALDVLLGEGPAPIPRGGTLAGAVKALAVPDSVPAALLSRRPDIQQAERQYAAATARLGVADAARLPTVMLTGSYGSQSAKPERLFNTNTRIYQLQAGISFPLFDAGRLADQSAAARARVEQARLQYEQTALSALRDANDALVAVRTSRDQEAAQATQVQALRDALELAQLRYESGLASYLDLLDAQRSLFSAQIALSQAQLQQLTAAVQLYKALGGGWPAAK
ncbi:MAG TPA: efflux transporter outer membrane subunit [Gemmatimonadaceae bacterium]|nr:efflux transporter outer membrane subunit [Gemmatimonadaceae bacterium]